MSEVIQSFRENFAVRVFSFVVTEAFGFHGTFLSARSVIHITLFTLFTPP